MSRCCLSPSISIGKHYRESFSYMIIYIHFYLYNHTPGVGYLWHVSSISRSHSHLSRFPVNHCRFPIDLHVLYRLQRLHCSLAAPFSPKNAKTYKKQHQNNSKSNKTLDPFALVPIPAQPLPISGRPRRALSNSKITASSNSPIAPYEKNTIKKSSNKLKIEEKHGPTRTFVHSKSTIVDSRSS